MPQYGMTFLGIIGRGIEWIRRYLTFLNSIQGK